MSGYKSNQAEVAQCRAVTFHVAGRRFEPFLPLKSQRRAGVARLTHNQKVGGSNPPVATNQTEKGGAERFGESGRLITGRVQRLFPEAKEIGSPDDILFSRQKPLRAANSVGFLVLVFPAID